MVSSRPPNLQKTKEKLKNPQEPRTQVPESQEGLKQQSFCAELAQQLRRSRPESQEGLKRKKHGWQKQDGRPESQEGLKQEMRRGGVVVTTNVQNLKKG